MATVQEVDAGGGVVVVVVVGGGGGGGGGGVVMVVVAAAFVKERASIERWPLSQMGPGRIYERRNSPSPEHAHT